MLLEFITPDAIVFILLGSLECKLAAKAALRNARRRRRPKRIRTKFVLPNVITFKWSAEFASPVIIQLEGRLLSPLLEDDISNVLDGVIEGCDPGL